MSRLNRQDVRQLQRDALRKSTDGKRAKAPCGHDGEVVIGSFVRCLAGCDGEAVPGYVPREKTKCAHNRTGWFHSFGYKIQMCMDCKEQLWP